VKNDLQVVPASTRKAVTADDKAITKSVESRLSKDPDLKKVDVRTDAGVVRAERPGREHLGGRACVGNGAQGRTA
jgi:hypothetical protein